MKRFLGLLVALLPIGVGAETIQLVTVLPSPVGSFFRLEQSVRFFQSIVWRERDYRRGNQFNCSR